ncbi:MAG TPA: hypothetical protein VEB60_00185 [Candidatus Paceibacterota bacterium]|nr:hypothetical protein [Candidatus Paceibacterota bacterium]
MVICADGHQIFDALKNVAGKCQGDEEYPQGHAVSCLHTVTCNGGPLLLDPKLQSIRRTEASIRKHKVPYFRESVIAKIGRKISASRSQLEAIADGILNRTDLIPERILEQIETGMKIKGTDKVKLINHIGCAVGQTLGMDLEYIAHSHFRARNWIQEELGDNVEVSGQLQIHLHETVRRSYHTKGSNWRSCPLSNIDLVPPSENRQSTEP